MRKTGQFARKNVIFCFFLLFFVALKTPIFADCLKSPDPNHIKITGRLHNICTCKPRYDKDLNKIKPPLPPKNDSTDPNSAANSEQPPQKSPFLTLKTAINNENPNDIASLESLWKNIAKTHLSPVGSPAEIPLKDTENADFPLQNPPLTTAWLDLSTRLYQNTGDITYPHAIEHTIYNAITSIPENLNLVTKTIYTTDTEGVRIEFFEQSTAKIDLLNQKITITQKTDFPAAGDTVINVQVDKPKEFTIKIRIPQWAENPSAQINGSQTDITPYIGQYLKITGKWPQNTEIRIKLGMRTFAWSTGKSHAALARGPEVMSIKQQDNPALDLNSVKIPHKTNLEPAGSTTNARRLYTATVLVEEKPQQAIFTPYADAANSHGKFRTVFPLAD